MQICSGRRRVRRDYVVAFTPMRTSPMRLVNYVPGIFLIDASVVGLCPWKELGLIHY